MDVDDVRACLRGLLSSTSFSYSLKALLNDFRNMTGFELPLFGCVNAREFLRTLSDTVQLIGDPLNPQVALVESKKSAHIISLVDRQKNSAFINRHSGVCTKQKRVIVPNESTNEANCMTRLSQQRSSGDIMTSKKIFRHWNSSGGLKEQNPKSMSCPVDFDNNSVDQLKDAVTPAFQSVASKPMKQETLNKEFEKSYLGNSSSLFRQECLSTELVRVEKPLEPLEEKMQEETDSCFFEVLSDDDCFSNSSPTSNSESVVNAGVKNKCKVLIKNYPEGLWCCELPQLFLKEFQSVLDYREFGYTSLIQMVSELSDVFRCVRPGNGDWILFDASVPPTVREQKMRNLESGTEINSDIKRNLWKLLLNCSENKVGIEVNKVLDLYEKMFGTSLDFELLGFKDLKSFLESWEDSFVNIVEVDDQTFIVPGLKQTSPLPIQWEDAVPPITAENDIFAEIFPNEVVGPDESFPEIDLKRHMAVGNMVEVCVGEVWSPKKFYLQLNKFKRRLNVFMDDLQCFYGTYLNKYKMPDSTIRPNQICVGLYNSDPDIPEEWHRAQIVKVINEKTALINFVDFGTLARVKKSHLRFLHRSFQSFPIQAFLAQLSGVVPPNNETKWPLLSSKKFLDLTRVNYLTARIDEVDFKIPCLSVTLFHPFQKSEISLNQQLILEKLAWVKDPTFEDPFEVPFEVSVEAQGTNSETVRKEENSETRMQDSVSMKEEKEGSNGKTFDEEEDLKKNLSKPTDEFSDISDLDQTTSFHAKMRNLTLEDYLPSKKESDSNESHTNFNVTFEFEEVLDLEKNDQDVVEAAADKEIQQCNLFENEENRPERKIVSLHPKIRIQNSHKKPQETGPTKGGLHQMSSSITGKPNRLPPGLEHMNVTANLNQSQFYLQPEDFRKKVNILAMELMATKPSIRQVGMNNPALALEIATEMAEIYVAYQYSGRVPYNLDPLLRHPYTDCLTLPLEWQSNGFEMKEPAEPNNTVFPVSPLVPKPTETVTSVADKKDFVPLQGTPEISRGKDQKESECVEVKQIGNRSVHLVTIDDIMYFSAEEIVRKFTILSSREFADRLLQVKKFHPNYRIITENKDEKVLNAINSSEMALSLRQTKKLKIHLVPMEEVVPILRCLGCVTEDFEKDFLELQAMEKEKTNAKKAELS